MISVEEAQIPANEIMRLQDSIMVLHIKCAQLTAENDELARQVDYLLRERMDAKRRERGSEAFGGESAADDPGAGRAGGRRSNEGAVHTFSFGRDLESLEAVARIVCANVVTTAPRRWWASYGIATDKIETCCIAQSLIGGEQGF